jgi:putative membrane protein
MKSTGIAVLAAGLLVIAPLCAAQTDKKASSDRATGSANRMNEPAAADQSFAMKAAQGGMAEVDLGNLAKDKASSDAVKNFGQKMVDDHTKANNELKDLAAKQNITLPTSLAAKDQAEKDRLSKLSGAAFDRAYMKHMVADHRKDVAEFKKESSSGKNADLKAWAGKTVPTLEEHLKMAEDTERQVASGSSSKTKAATK